VDAAICHVFTTGGKMIRQSKGVPVAPQNQTISAILLLSRLPLGERLFWSGLRKREAERGKPFDLDEIWKELDRARASEHDLRRRQLRIVVHENPYARIPLHPELFRGPYDERYGGLDGRIQRLFCGGAMAALLEVG
jgi:hypothetical protein